MTQSGRSHSPQVRYSNNHVGGKMSVNWKTITGLLGIVAFVGLLIFAGRAIQVYVVEILSTATIFVLLVIRGVSPPKAISYCSFFLVATVLAKLYWRLSTDAPPVAVHELIYPTIIMVVFFSLIGFLSWPFLKKWSDENLLIAIIVLTVWLPVVFFVSLSYQFFDWYVWLYVVICLAAPLVVLAQTWSKPREPHARG